METNNKRVQYQVKYNYIEGNTVRKQSYVGQHAVRNNSIAPERHIRDIPRPERRITEPGRQIYRQPRYMTSISKSTLLVLTLAIAATLYFCIEFLMLQHQVSKMEKEIVSMERTLSTMMNENDAAYEQIKMAYDLDYVYNIAVNELGMVYPNNNEVITFERTDESYVRQYADIPK